MSTDTISIELKKREIIRKKLAVLRETGEVPVVVHDHGKPSIHASASMMPLQKVVSVAGKHHPIEVKVGSEDRLVLIRDVDYDPRKHHLRHVVFQAIRRNQKAHAEIPIEFTGDIPAERSSLMVIYQLDHVEVEALPSDLPAAIFVDPSALVEVGDTMLVGDLQAPKGVIILTEATYPIATVEMPKDQLAEAEASAESLAEDAETTGIDDEETPATEASSEDDDSSDDSSTDEQEKE
ncbi:hypothetical protein BH23PAT2_BH23PAT2_05230 [soil metagenome]